MQSNCMHKYHNLNNLNMGTTLIIFSAISIGLLAGSILSVLYSQPTSAQMMNPDMMFNGTGLNPNMMFNGTGINPMFMQDQNITGSIKLAPTLINSIASQIKVSLSDAAAIVQNQAGNKSNVVVAHLDVANGYLTYTVIAVDHDANIHKFVIDAGNGKVLSSSKLSLQNMMMFGGIMGHNMMGSMMGHNMMGSMMGHNMMGSMMGHNMMNPNMMGNMMGFQ
jgi:hypothetical protein